MLHLKAFGGLSVDIDGIPGTGAAQQRKTLALLALLAAARQRGLSRDKLIASLWPETDAERGRGLLNQACYTLRRDLHTPDLFLGSIQLRLNPAVISSDVESFARALEEHDPARAVAFYTAPFLDGFYLNGGGEFETWAETERARLASQCRAALEALSQEATGRGEHRLAAEWGGRLLALDPLSSHAALGLMTALDHAGEPAEALRCGEAYGELVRSELGTDPPPELSQWIEQHRHVAGNGAPEARLSTAALQRALALELPSPVIPVTLTGKAKHLRRNGALALMGLILVGAATIWSLRPSPIVSRASLSPTTIAVLPFAYRGNPEFTYLAEGMVDLLGADLSGAGEIRTIDPHAVLARTRYPDGKWSPQQAGKISAQLGAGSYVLGDITEAGGRLRISARLYRVGSEDEAREVAAVDGAAAQLFRLVDALTIQLLKTRGRDPGLPQVNLAALTTDSLAALKAYLEGERALRAWCTDSAVGVFQRATEIDPSFALAYYRLAIAAQEKPALARKALNQALRYSARLGDHERKLVHALDAFNRGHQKDAERLYRELVTRYPNDFEAWSQWGDVLMHGGSRLGRSWFDARQPFERVLSMEPRDPHALWNLSNIAARQRRVGELDSLTRRILQGNPGPLEAAAVRAQRAIVVGDTAELARFMAQMRRASDNLAQPTVGFLTFTTGDLEAGRRLWGLITDPSRARATRMLAYKTLAQIELMSGRWRAAQARLDTMAGLDPATALEHRALFALWPLQQVSRIDLEALRDSLVRWKASPGPTNETLLSAELGPAHPYLRLYLLGLFAARLGEPSAALRYAAELKRRSRFAFAPDFVADLGRSVAAEVARLGGQTQVALQLLDQGSFWTRTDVQPTGASPFYVHEYERFIRAELLNALGRSNEALMSYVQLADVLFHSGAPAHLRLAQIYDHQGDRRRALDHYRRFIALWKDCDPQLRPLVVAAQQRVNAVN
ncbi:MAG TPA: BTAD domain-containing putative transcriptional regulator [Gemmatimonadales bacterium]|nr:BTAD domain-containing putative transcriptional regulator [Gemmatimonadales bacterium]